MGLESWPEGFSSYWLSSFLVRFRNAVNYSVKNFAAEVKNYSALVPKILNQHERFVADVQDRDRAAELRRDEGRRRRQKRRNQHRQAAL